MCKNSQKSKFFPHTQQTQEIFYRILSRRRRFFTANSVDVGDFLPHTEQTWNIFYRILTRRGIISKICHPAVVCQRSRLRIIFTAYSVHVGDFLPHTQYTQEIFYRILSTRRRFFTAYSAHVAQFLPLTQQAWNIFCAHSVSGKKNKMANNSLTIHTNRFFALVLKSPIQMGWLSIINSVTNISRLGTFK